MWDNGILETFYTQKKVLMYIYESDLLFYELNGILCP